MTNEAISLLTYLESRAVLHRGMLNKNKLTQADWLSMQQLQQMGKLEIKKLKSPDRTVTPLFTHKIRLSEELYQLAWQARKEKAEQHNPTLHSPPEKTAGGGNGIPALREGEGEQGEAITQEPELFKEFRSFLSAHKSKLTHVQSGLAKELFEIFEKPEYKFFLNNKATGKTWLFSTIDQFFDACNHYRNRPPEK